MSLDGMWAELDAVEDSRAGDGTVAVLELLADGAPAEQFDALVAEAAERGASGARLDALERARRLGMAVSARLDRHHRREAGFSGLVDTARDLLTPYDLDTLLKVIARRARLLLGVDACYVALPDEEAGHVRVCAADGNVSTGSLGLRLAADAGIGAAVLADAAPWCTPDYLADTRFRHGPTADDVVDAEGVRAMMAVPISYGAQPFGVLYAADRTVRHFTADERALAGSLGDLAGAAIQKARHVDQTTAGAARLEQRAARAEDALKEAGELADHQSAMLDTVLGGGDPQAVADDASGRLGGYVRICSVHGSVLAAAGDLPDGQRADRQALVAAAMDAHAAGAPVSLEDGTWAAPIVAGRDRLGTLLLSPWRRVTDRDRRLLRLAAQAAAIALRTHGGTDTATQDQLRAELLDELLATPTPDAAAREGREPLGRAPHAGVARGPRELDTRARRVGVDLTTPHLVVVARPGEGARSKASVWASCYAHRMRGLGTLHDGCLVLLLPGTEAGAAARAVSEELSPLLGRPTTIAAAGPGSGADSVSPGYREALRCLDAMVALGAEGQAASARELGFLGLLLSGARDAEGFVDATIGAVLDHDRERCTELARTLDAYFDAGRSPRHAADQLYVHPNTVARRLERIAELLGPDWQKPERALDIQLALRLRRISHALRSPADGLRAGGLREGGLPAGDATRHAPTDGPASGAPGQDT